MMKQMKQRNILRSLQMLFPSRGSDVDGKLEFDLTEGFNANDGKFGEPVNVCTPGCSAVVHLINPLSSFPFFNDQWVSSFNYSGCCC